MGGANDSSPQHKGGEEQMGPEHVQVHYKGYAKYERNVEEYQRVLSQLCPQVVKDGGSLSLVRIDNRCFKAT